MMVKKDRYVDDIANESLPLYEPQRITLKATNNKEALPNMVAQVEAAGLNEDELALVIKLFKTALKGHKDYPNKSKSMGMHFCFKCDKSGHFITQCLDNENDQGQEKNGRRRKRTTKRQRARLTSTRSGTRTALHPTPMMRDLLPQPSTSPPSSPNEHHTCLMAKEKKARTRDTPKYTSSIDEESDDDDVDYSDLFKGLDRSKVDKINELIDALNEKDRLLEKQEDILYEEHDKLVNVEKSLALETKKNETLSSELSSCH
jgi:hypothetical protein